MLRLLALAVGASAIGPTMNFLHKADCGEDGNGIDEVGNFNLSISVAGQKGFSYDCSTNYDPAVGVAEKDCIDWLTPANLLSEKENLDITLRAHDTNGQQATCMKWELVFDGQVNGLAWDPPPFPENVYSAMRGPMEELQRKVETLKPANTIAPRNNTEASRIQAMWNYMDSMTYLSHRCAGKDPNWVGLITLFPNWAFPTTAQTEIQMRLSHALLAAHGIIWSIDRTSKDAWKLPTSCVPSIPGLPHCHIDSEQTWKLGPGGVATWSIRTLSHQIPSPGITLLEDYKGQGGGEYNNKGCGDTRRGGTSFAV